MPDSPQLKMMRERLVQLERCIDCVHADHDRELLEDEAKVLRNDIKHLEKWEKEPNRKGIL